MTVVDGKTSRITGGSAEPEPAPVSPEAERPAPQPLATSLGPPPTSAAPRPGPLPPKPLPITDTSPDRNAMADIAAVRALASFKRLAPPEQQAVVNAASARPTAVRDLLEWTGDPAFDAMPQDQQRAHYAAFSAGALASNRGGVRRRDVEQMRIAVVFPGQRAVTGRGEMADALRRAEQARRLFPAAQIDVVVFDPPERVSGGVIEARAYRSVDYLHAMRGWAEPWDYRNQPTRADRGLNFVYATAPADGSAFTERYDYALNDYDRPGGYNRVPQGPEHRQRKDALGMNPSADSLGMRAVQNANVVINAGAASTNSASWVVGSRGDAIRTPIFSFIEPDQHWPVPGRAVRTTLSDPAIGFRDYDQRSVDALRARVTELTPGATPSDAVTRARTALLRDEVHLPAALAARLARMPWAVGYHHPTFAQDFVNDTSAWREAVGAAARQSGHPSVSFLINGSASRSNSLPGFRNLTPTSVAPGIDRYMVPGGEVYVLAPQATRTYQGLMAGSQLPTLVTGTNSLGDAIAMGKPFLYGALGWQHEKTTTLLHTARPILLAAGFTPEAVDLFEGALPRISNLQGEPLTEAQWAETTARWDRMQPHEQYRSYSDPKSLGRIEPTLEEVARLYADPELARRMFETVSRGVVVDDGAKLRDMLAVHAADPREALFNAVARRQDPNAVMASPEVQEWLKTATPAQRAGIVRFARQLSPATATGAVGLLATRTASAAANDPVASATLGFGAGMSTQMMLDSGTAAMIGQTVAARTLLTGAITGMPGAALTSRVLGEALQRAGVDPRSLGYDATVFAGTLGVHAGGTIAQAYALAAGRAAIARGLASTARVAAPVGAVMLADMVAGLAWSALDNDAEYKQQLGLIALRLDTGGGANVVREVAQAALPTTVAASGLTMTSPESRQQAARLIRDGAQGAELAMIARLTRALHGATNDGAALSRFADTELASTEAQDLLKMVRLASGPTRTGFSSTATSMTPGGRPSRDSVRDFIDTGLMPLLERRASETTQRLVALTRAPTTPDNVERATTLVRELQLLSLAADLRGRLPAQWKSYLEPLPEDEIPNPWVYVTGA